MQILTCTHVIVVAAGVIHQPGTIVAFEDVEAARLLALGAVRPTNTPDPRPSQNNIPIPYPDDVPQKGIYRLPILPQWRSS